MAVEKLAKVWPEWKVEKQLGKGSYGVVYKVVREDSNIKSHAAVKIISIPTDESEIDSLRSEGLSQEGAKTYFQGIVNDFVGEIRLMESLKGVQNIVSVEDYKVVENTEGIGWDIFIRMELLTPFNTYICDKQMTESDVVKLGVDICTALEICGQREIVHRDIKPENIFINDFGYFKLGDFGIARKLENATGGMSQKGTFNYMAPEVATGTSYDARVDIYSLGIVLYRLLNNNRLPFIENEQQLQNPNERKLAVERRIRGEKMAPPCNASSQVAAVIMRACAYNPQSRFANATQMREALMRASIGAYQEQDVDLDKTVSVRHAAQSPMYHQPAPPVTNRPPMGQPPVNRPPVNAAPPVMNRPPVNAAPPVTNRPPVNAAPPVTNRPPVNAAPPVTKKPPVAVGSNTATRPPVNFGNNTGNHTGTRPPVNYGNNTGNHTGTRPPVNYGNNTGNHTDTRPPVNYGNNTGNHTGTRPPVNYGNNTGNHTGTGVNFRMDGNRTSGSVSVTNNTYGTFPGMKQSATVEAPKRGLNILCLLGLILCILPLLAEAILLAVELDSLVTTYAIVMGLTYIPMLLAVIGKNGAAQKNQKGKVLSLIGVILDVLLSWLYGDFFFSALSDEVMHQPDVAAVIYIIYGLLFTVLALVLVLTAGRKKHR